MVNARYGVPSAMKSFLAAPAEKKDYTYVDLNEGAVKACSKDDAYSLCRCDDYFVITPEGNWLDIDAQIREVNRG